MIADFAMNGLFALWAFNIHESNFPILV